MRYTPLSASFYQNNRKKFCSQMKQGTIAIFHSNDILPTNADGTMAFHQNADMFYLTGVDQEESALVVFPSCHLPGHREILFLRETNDEIAIWEGQKLTKEAARELTGIKTIYWLHEFDRVMKAVMNECDGIYLNGNEHSRRGNDTETREDRLNKVLRQQYPYHTIYRSAPILQRLRSIKADEEVAQMRKACAITEAGFRRLLRTVKPGLMEYELEAELLHEFVRRGSRKFAYTPIIAGGFNSCVLHYIENNQPLKDGDILLLDIGAEYGYYASDLSRTIPVNGRYTPRQRQVYDAVLRVHRQAAKLLKPGVMLHEYQRQVGEAMEKELVDLRLLSLEDIRNQDNANPAYRRYFMHGTSHFLGIDVHDVGPWNEPVQVGQVFTIEPGIYIREESLGVRIENNYLVTANGLEDLMGNIPIEAEEIEQLMHESR